MKLEEFNRMVEILKREKQIGTRALAVALDTTARRLYDVLLPMEYLGMIERPKKGLIKWVARESDKPISTYDCRIIEISSNGAITQVRNNGMQSVVIEQTAEGFTVNPLDG